MHYMISAMVLIIVIIEMESTYLKGECKTSGGEPLTGILSLYTGCEKE